jgi:hypothetical protein
MPESSTAAVLHHVVADPPEARIVIDWGTQEHKDLTS